jgi:hypothetical protein
MEIKNSFGIKGKFKAIKTDDYGRIIEETPFYENIVVDGADTGFNLVLDRLNSDNTYSLNITHLDIGTSITTPTVADVLTGAVARASKVTGSVSGSSLTLRFYFASADLANGNYYDVKLAVDGTSTINTGKCFSRALFGSVLTKASSENITIEYVLSKA